MSDQPERRLVDGSEPATPEALLARLEALGIAAQTFTHQPVFTVEEAKAHRGDLTGAHTKNLFVRDKKGRMWLIVSLEDRTVDLKGIAEKLGHKRFSFGSEERLMKYLGVIRGAVTPFGVLNDRTLSVRVALDTGLKEFDLWNFHPLDNGMTTTLTGDDMVRFLDAVEHPPTWVDLGVTAIDRGEGTGH